MPDTTFTKTQALLPWRSLSYGVDSLTCPNCLIKINTCMPNIHLKSEHLIPCIHHHHPNHTYQICFHRSNPHICEWHLSLASCSGQKHWCCQWLLFLTVHFQSISKSFCLYLHNKCRTGALLTSSAATITANTVITNLPASS